MKPKHLSVALSALFVVLTLILAACGGAATPAPADANNPSASQPDANAAYPAQQQPAAAAVEAQANNAYPVPLPADAILQVTKSDGTVAHLTMADLQKLSSVKLDVEGGAEGPLLSDVLNAAGVADYTSVILTGKDNKFTILSKEQVTDKVVLSYSGDSSVRLVGSNIDSSQWVDNVTWIKVY